MNASALTWQVQQYVIFKADEAAQHVIKNGTCQQAHIQLTHDGQYVVDTPEVQHARAAHLQQYSAAAHAAAAAPEEPWGGHGHSGWH